MPEESTRRRSSRRRKKEGEQENVHAMALYASPPSRRKRRSSRGSSSIWQLARHVVEGSQVVFIAGAGMSVASGIRPFRNSGTPSSSPAKHKSAKRSKREGNQKKKEQPTALWDSVIWTQGTRKAFRKDPLKWYNEFWLRFFPPQDEFKYDPNEGHLALAALQSAYPNVKLITQNVDGLHHRALMRESGESAAAALEKNIVEAHGRLGLYKCIPDEDSDTDSSSDEDDDRLVHLGHRRKSRAWKRQYHFQKQDSSVEGDSSVDKGKLGKGAHCVPKKTRCRFQMLESLTVDKFEVEAVQGVLTAEHYKATATSTPKLAITPTCPECGGLVLPQALLFDEGYHSHGHYQFEKMERWLSDSHALVFCGTSFAVTLPQVALDHARALQLPVFNFNVADTLEPTARLNAENIIGPSQETLPSLLQAIQRLETEYREERLNS